MTAGVVSLLLDLCFILIIFLVLRFRFCPKKYEPFDPEDVDQYVVGDDYIPIWEIPSLNESYVDLKFGMRDSLNIFLRKQGMYQ